MLVPTMVLVVVDAGNKALPATILYAMVDCVLEDLRLKSSSSKDRLLSGSTIVR